MKKLIKTLILGFFVLNFLYGEEGEIELVPVYEKTFGTIEPIVDMIWDTVKISVKEAKRIGIKGVNQMSDTIKINVKFPKVVIVGESSWKVRAIKFFDVRGKILKTIKLERKLREIFPFYQVNISENKKYLGITFKVKHIKDNLFEHKCVILDKEGKVLWSVLRGTNEYEIYISPNGRYFLGTDIEYERAPIEIYFQNGIKREILKDDRIINIKFSPNGSFCCVYFFTWEKNVKNFPEKLIGNLLLMNEEGNVLWKKENIVKGEQALWATISEVNNDGMVIFTINFLTPQLQKKYYISTKGEVVKVEGGTNEK